MTDNKKVRGIYLCSFCGKNQDETQRLIAGPGGVYICDECIAKISEYPEAEGVVAEAREQVRCSFCGKKAAHVHYCVRGPGGINICNECIELCMEIIEEGKHKATDVDQGGWQKTQR